MMELREPNLVALLQAASRRGRGASDTPALTRAAAGPPHAPAGADGFVHTAEAPHHPEETLWALQRVLSGLAGTGSGLKVRTPEAALARLTVRMENGAVPLARLAEAIEGPRAQQWQAEWPQAVREAAFAALRALAPRSSEEATAALQSFIERAIVILKSASAPSADASTQAAADVAPEAAVQPRMPEAPTQAPAAREGAQAGAPAALPNATASTQAATGTAAYVLPAAPNASPEGEQVATPRAGQPFASQTSASAGVPAGTPHAAGPLPATSQGKAPAQLFQAASLASAPPNAEPQQQVGHAIGRSFHLDGTVATQGEDRSPSPALARETPGKPDAPRDRSSFANRSPHARPEGTVQPLPSQAKGLDTAARLSSGEPVRFETGTEWSATLPPRAIGLPSDALSADIESPPSVPTAQWRGMVPLNFDGAFTPMWMSLEWLPGAEPEARRHATGIAEESRAVALSIDLVNETLGRIGFRLIWMDGSLSGSVRAERPEVAAEARAELPSLVSGLEAAGLSPGELQVLHERGGYGL